MHDLDELLISHSATSLLLPACSGIVPALSGWASIWRHSIDVSLSTVSGPGSHGFLPGAAARNRIIVIPRISTSAIAEYIMLDDLQLCITSVDASECGAVCGGQRIKSGGMQLQYRIYSVTTFIKLHVTISGVPIWSSSIPCAAVSGDYALQARSLWRQAINTAWL